MSKKRHIPSTLFALRSLLLACLFVVGPAVGTVVGGEGNLHALVIGNSDYRLGKLKNPVNDAKAVGSALTNLGFQVTQITNANQVNIEDAILKFSRSVEKDGLAFFFFAGHGVQVKGENYLIPIDAKIREEFEVRHQCVSLSLVLDALENSPSNLNVIVLDSCRDNPFARAWSRSSRSGLAGVAKIPEGTLIAFATPPGETALDGKGTNSPFTTELVTALAQRPKTGLLLRDVFFDASRRVKQKVGQRPWVNMEASLSKFYLTKPNKNPVEVPNADMVAAGLSPSPEKAKSEPKIPPPPSNSIASSGAAPSNPSLSNAGSLFDQANVFMRDGDYENAIVALSAILNDPSIDSLQRNRARMSRGSAYLARAEHSDLELAIIDYKAAGKPGVRLPVRVDSSDLKVGKDSVGTVIRNQSLLVTLSRGEWLWVDSVNDNDSIQGYVKKSAVFSALKTRVASQDTASSSKNGSASKVVSTPKNTSNPLPANATTTSASPVSGLTPADATTMSNGISSSTLQNYPPGLTTNSGASGVVTSTIQPQNTVLQPQTVVPNQSLPSTTAVPSNPQTFQPGVTYIQQNGQWVPMTTQSGVSGTVSGVNQPAQQFVQPSNQTQRYAQQGQAYQPTQTHRTQTHRTYSPQQQSSGISQFIQPQRTSSLKDLNAQRRDFDREVSRYQWKNGPLSATERQRVNQWRIQNDRAKAKAFWGN